MAEQERDDSDRLDWLARFGVYATITEDGTMFLKATRNGSKVPEGALKSFRTLIDSAAKDWA